MQTCSSHGNCFYVYLYSIYFYRVWNGVEIIIFIFKRPIRAEVVTYRLDVAVGSLYMQQLHGFDELRNDQVTIQNRSVKMDTAVISLYISASYFRFRLLPLAKIIERMENGKIVLFGRSDGGREHHLNPF
jgi:hypothetical protein